METLLFAVIGLFRRPHTMRKISIFALFVAASVIAAHTLSRLSDNVVLAFLVKWLWLSLSAAYLICRYGEPLKRRRLKQFFRQMKFWGVDGKLPQYVNTVSFNRYLVKNRFKSRIHISKWQKIKPELESFFNSKITLI